MRVSSLAYHGTHLRVYLPVLVLRLMTLCSREDLEELLRSPAYFDAFFGTLPQTLAMHKEHEELLKANEELVGT